MKTLIAAATFAALTLTAGTAPAQFINVRAPAAPREAPARDCGALPGPFDGKAFAGDGDTIYGTGYGTAIRLWGIQAPELRDHSPGAAKAETVAGMKTRGALEDLLAAADWQVRCVPRKFDRFCRVVASCTTAKGIDPSLELLKAGHAYGFWLSDTDDAAQSIAYARAEAEARSARRGQWSEWLGEPAKH